MKTNYSVEEVYSILSQLVNELEDDLGLDLGKGEYGYKSYEESYKAVRKYTLRKLKVMVKRAKNKTVIQEYENKQEVGA